MMNPIRVTPVPTPSPSVSSSAGLRRSPTSWTLADMARMLAEQQQHTQQQTHSDDVVAAAAKRNMCMRKPPRHSNVPMCAQILLKLWQRELQRTDVSLTSDFFYDLAGSDEQAFYIVDRMQRMGFSISLQQFFSLPRCSIYSVLLVAL